MVDRDWSRGRGFMPEGGHEMLLDVEKGWVAAGFELGSRPVELIDLRVVRWKCCNRKSSANPRIELTETYRLYEDSS